MKKQRAEDQISPGQRAKLIELWQSGYDPLNLCERFGISTDSAALVIKAANADQLSKERAAETVAQRYRDFLMDRQTIG